MGKLFTPQDILSGFQTTDSLNNNFAAIETALDACLSRTGESPNSMSADIDMNGNGLLNIGTLDVDVLLVDGEQVPSLEDIQEAFASWDDNTAAVLAAATAAQVAAETAQAGAETAETNAETAQTAAEAAQAAAEAAAVIALPTGFLTFFAGQTAPTGWLARDGASFGSAASGATNASDDYEALYLLLWDNIPDVRCPVSGSRGASAAADWAANKPMGMLDDRGLFMRGFDDSGLVDTDRAGAGFGEYQADENKAHTHTFSSNTASGGANTINTKLNSTNDSPTTTNSSGGAESRPQNAAYLPIIKY